MKKFAAFDIDGTIGRNSIFLQIVEELISRGSLPKSFLFDLQTELDAYKRRLHADAFKDYSTKAVGILFDNLATINVTDYRSAVDTVMTNAKEYVYVYTRDLIESLRSKGYFLIAISGSEMYAVQQFAERYKFDVAIGEIYYEKNGKFTGEVMEVFHKKDTFLKSLMAEHDLTIKGSIGIGDSMGDLSMLEFVENPIAFNPESRLFEVAKQKGWKIVVERKNVIYELEKNRDVYRLI